MAHFAKYLVFGEQLTENFINFTKQNKEITINKLCQD